MDLMLSILFNIDLILIGVNCTLDLLIHSDNQEGLILLNIKSSFKKEY